MFDPEKEVRIWVPGPAMSKLRTRSRKGGGGVYNLQEYTNWKAMYALTIYRAFHEAKKTVFSQKDDFSKAMIRGNTELCPIKSASVKMLFCGGMRGDPSNRLNGVLDVLLDANLLADAQIICNDSTNHQPQGFYQCDKSSKIVGTMIIVAPYIREKFNLDKLNNWGAI